MYRKLGKGIDDGMNSQASFPTQLDADQVSMISGNNAGRFNSESDFNDSQLEPVNEEQSQVDEDEVLLNVSPNKFEKPKDQLYMDFFVKYTELFVDEAKKDSKHKNKFAVSAADTDIASNKQI